MKGFLQLGMGRIRRQGHVQICGCRNTAARSESEEKEIKVSGISKEGQAGGGDRLGTEIGGERKLTMLIIHGLLTVYQALC